MNPLREEDIKSQNFVSLASIVGENDSAKSWDGYSDLRGLIGEVAFLNKKHFPPPQSVRRVLTNNKWRGLELEAWVDKVTGRCYWAVGEGIAHCSLAEFNSDRERSCARAASLKEYLVSLSKKQGLPTIKVPEHCQDENGRWLVEHMPGDVVWNADNARLELPPPASLKVGAVDACDALVCSALLRQLVGDTDPEPMANTVIGQDGVVGVFDLGELSDGSEEELSYEAQRLFAGLEDSDDMGFRGLLDEFFGVNKSGFIPFLLDSFKKPCSQMPLPIVWQAWQLQQRRLYCVEAQKRGFHSPESLKANARKSVKRSFDNAVRKSPGGLRFFCGQVVAMVLHADYIREEEQKELNKRAEAEGGRSSPPIVRQDSFSCALGSISGAVVELRAGQDFGPCRG